MQRLFTTKHLGVCAFLFLLSSTMTVAQGRLEQLTHDFFNKPEKVLVAAHRAAHLTDPENSLAAISKAIDLGADIIEIDVRRTKDGEFILMHDKTVNRTTDMNGLVSELNFSDLAGASLIMNGQVTTEKIPTLRQALNLAKGKIFVDIDFKANVRGDAAEAIRIIKDLDMQKQVLFFLYDYRDIPFLQELDTSIMLMPRARSRDDFLQILNNYKVPVIHIDDSFYDDELMEKANESNIRLWSNALGKYDALEHTKKDSGYDQMMKMKYVNIIQTDFPAKLLEFLRLHSRR